MTLALIVILLVIAAWLVKSIVALHGGSVSLVSEVGAGTRVTLRFPIGAGERPLGPELRALGGA